MVSADKAEVGGSWREVCRGQDPRVGGAGCLHSYGGMDRGLQTWVGGRVQALSFWGDSPPWGLWGLWGGRDCVAHSGAAPGAGGLLSGTARGGGV